MILIYILLPAITIQKIQERNGVTLEGCLLFTSFLFLPNKIAQFCILKQNKLFSHSFYGPGVWVQVN